MRSSFIATLCCIAIISIGCNQSASDEFAGLSEREKKLIDDQISLINLLPSSAAGCCDTYIQLERVINLAATDIGHKYATRLIDECKSRVRGELIRFLEARLRSSVSNQLITNNYNSFVQRKRGSNWEVVSIKETSKNITVDDNATHLNLEHTLSLREHTGLFRADNFAVVRAKQSITARPNCGGVPPEDIVFEYTAELVD